MTPVTIKSWANPSQDRSSYTSPTFIFIPLKKKTGNSKKKIP